MRFECQFFYKKYCKWESVSKIQTLHETLLLVLVKRQKQKGRRALLSLLFSFSPPQSLNGRRRKGLKRDEDPQNPTLLSLSSLSPPNGMTEWKAGKRRRGKDFCLFQGLGRRTEKELAPVVAQARFADLDGLWGQVLIILKGETMLKTL